MTLVWPALKCPRCGPVRRELLDYSNLIHRLSLLYPLAYTSGGVLDDETSRPYLFENYTYVSTL